MPNTYNDGIYLSFSAGMDLEKNRIVKQSASNEVKYIAQGENSVGVTVDEGVTGDIVAVKPWNAPGSFAVNVVDGCSTGNDLHTANSGQATTSATTGTQVGIATESVSSGGIAETLQEQRQINYM